MSGATPLSQMGPGNDGNDGILYITGNLPSDCLVLYPGHSLLVSYTSTEKQSVHSTVLAD